MSDTNFVLDEYDAIEIAERAEACIEELTSQRDEAVKLLKRTLAHIAVPKASRNQAWHAEGEQLAVDTREFVAAMEG